jgi:hypothetical protein
VGLLSGCIFPFDAVVHGSDETTTVSNAFTGFSKVSISNACDAVVTRGEAYSMVVEVNDNIEKYLNVETSNGGVFITLDNNHNYTHLTFKVTITMPDLEAVTCSDASKLSISGFSSEKPFTASVSDASNVNGNISCGNVSIRASDASDITLTGNAGDLSCKATDASKLMLRNLLCKNVVVDVSDASEARVSVSGTISGKATDASKVTYYGDSVKGSISVHDGSKVLRGE